MHLIFLCLFLVLFSETVSGQPRKDAYFSGTLEFEERSNIVLPFKPLNPLPGELASGVRRFEFAVSGAKMLITSWDVSNNWEKVLVDAATGLTYVWREGEVVGHILDHTNRKQNPIGKASGPLGAAEILGYATNQYQIAAFNKRLLVDIWLTDEIRLLPDHLYPVVGLSLGVGFKKLETKLLMRKRSNHSENGAHLSLAFECKAIRPGEVPEAVFILPQNVRFERAPVFR